MITITLHIYKTFTPDQPAKGSISIGQISPSSTIRSGGNYYVTPPNSFIDHDVVLGQRYYYWATSVGEELDQNGNLVEVESPFVGPAEGYICGYDIKPGGASFGAQGGIGAVSVNALGGCMWGAYSDMDWLTVPGTPEGESTGIALFKVEPMNADGTRTATLSVADQPVTVTQTAPSPVSIFPTVDVIGSAAYSGRIAVTTTAGEAWQAQSNADWINLSASSGSGNGAVAFTTTENTTGAIRSAVISVNGLTYTIVQQAGPCAIALSPTGQIAGKEMATGSFTVTAPAGCIWTAMSDSSWLTVDAMTSAAPNGLLQKSSGSVTFTIAANTTSMPRKGAISIGGKTFAITQTGAVCSTKLTPSTASFATGGGQGAFKVETAADCQWAPMTADSWINIDNPNMVNGLGEVRFTVAENVSGKPRNGSISAGSSSFTVSQILMSITSLSRIHGSGAEFGSVKITAPFGSAWSALSGAPWIRIVNGQGSGAGQMDYRLEPNPAQAQRAGAVSIGGVNFNITQMGAECSYKISPLDMVHNAGKETGLVKIQAPANCAWTAVSLADWITITSADSGSGNGEVAYSITANAATASRKGTMSVAGAGYLVRQNGADCSASANMTVSKNYFTWEKATGTIDVATGAGCYWRPIADVDWIVFDMGSMMGPGKVTFTVGANESRNPRFGGITVLGKTERITQEEQICDYVITPQALSLAAGEAPVAVKVDTPWFCKWTATTADPWIVIGFGASMSGPGEVRYTARANLNAAPRTGSIKIQDSVIPTAGGTHLVTQASATCANATLLQPSMGAHGNQASTSGKLLITAPAFCPWTAASSAPWLTVTAPGAGAGSGAIGYSVSANSTGAVRTGTITVSGQTFTLTQKGAACP